jgi:hypothetical protein
MMPARIMLSRVRSMTKLEVVLAVADVAEHVVAVRSRRRCGPCVSRVAARI